MSRAYHVDAIVGRKPAHKLTDCGVTQEQLSTIAAELKKVNPDLNMTVLKRAIHHVLSAEKSPKGGVLIGGVLLGGGSLFDNIMSGLRNFNKVAPTVVGSVVTAVKGAKDIHGNVRGLVKDIKSGATADGSGGFSFGDFASALKSGAQAAKHVADATGVTDAVVGAAKQKAKTAALKTAAKYSGDLPAPVSAALGEIFARL